MAPSSCFYFLISTFLLLLFVSIQEGNAEVPLTKTFKFVNRGVFSRYSGEYGATYRNLPIEASPFRLCFYNTTPNAFTLAIGIGSIRLEAGMKWIWDANRRHLVKENAVFSFGQDGNLVLSDSDGTVAWQTATANQGVVALNLLPSGNLVLVDANGKFIWQSFDYPTDTLVNGMSLTYKGPKKLTARISDKDGSDGQYTFQLEKTHWSLYYTSLRYYKSDEFADKDIIANLTYVVDSATASSDAILVYRMLGSQSSVSAFLRHIKYRAPYSVLRVGSNGNVMIYSFANLPQPWETTYKLFDRDVGMDECTLPGRCGSLGLCKDSQCVGCPRVGGSIGWSESCAPPRRAPCRGGGSAKYFEMEGVDHFLSAYNEGTGPVSLTECRSRCSRDCKCLGFFYQRKKSSCYLAPVLGSLHPVDDPTHVAYIRTA